MATTNAPVIQCDVTRLPSQLRKLPQWVVWRLEVVEGRPKPAKIPYDPRSGKKASADDPTSWSSFEAARAALLSAPDKWHGLGFYFWRSDPFVGIDLDEAINENESVEDWARSILDRFPGAYVEHSQSGRGLHVIVRANAAGIFPEGQEGGKKGKIEVYSGRHYLALTGDVLLGYGDDVRGDDLTTQVVELVTMAGIGKVTEQHADTVVKDATPLQQTPRDAVRRAIRESKDGSRFFGLYEGDSHPGKASEEDLQLACIIARHTRDEDLIVEMMAESGRKRVKWSEKRGGVSWLRMTVREALDRTSTARFGAEVKPTPAIDVLEMEETAVVNWLVNDVWPTGARGWLAGEAKLGKSWLALDMAVAVATGTQFLGRFYTAQANVLFLTEESTSRKIRQRLDMLCAGRNLGIDALKGRLKTIVRQRVKLTEQAWLEQVLRDVTEHQAKLVIVDPMRRYHDGDENDATEVAPILNAFARIQDLGCSVVVVHHARKTGADDETRSGQNLRGSSDLHAWSDAAIYVGGKKGALTMAVEVELKDEEAPPGFLATPQFSERKGRTAVTFQLETGGVREISQQQSALAIRQVLESLKPGERLGINQIEKRCGAANKNVSPTLEAMAKRGEVNETVGPRNSRLWALSAITPAEQHEARSTDHGDVTSDEKPGF